MTLVKLLGWAFFFAVLHFFYASRPVCSCFAPSLGAQGGSETPLYPQALRPPCTCWERGARIHPLPAGAQTPAFRVVSQFENRCPGSPPVARSECMDHAGKIPLTPPLLKGEARKRRGISGQDDPLPGKKFKRRHYRLPYGVVRAVTQKERCENRCVRAGDVVRQPNRSAAMSFFSFAIH